MRLEKLDPPIDLDHDHVLGPPDAFGIVTGIRLPTLLLTGMNTYRTQADPTVKSVPLVAPNHESEFFDDLKDFQFADGNSFDFRGERERSIGGNGKFKQTRGSKELKCLIKENPA